MPGFKAFFACPITSFIDAERGGLRADYERFVQSVHQLLRAECDDVFLALEREGWGRHLMEPAVCTPLDFAAMLDCDVVVAYPGASCGVAVELGWASATGKYIVLLTDETTSDSPLIRGLASVPGTAVRMLDVTGARAAGSADSFAAELRAALGYARQHVLREAACRPARFTTTG